MPSTFGDVSMSDKLKYIDIHGHVNFPEYDSDREAVILRAKQLGVGMIAVGTDIQSSRKAIELSGTHDNVWAIIGIHPTDAKDVTDKEFSELSKLAEHSKVLAIGECGLDYFHSQPEDIAKQKEVFFKHIELANSLDKPLMLHVRNGKIRPGLDHDSAYQEVINILRERSRVRANFHFFAGTIKEAMDIVAMGNTMSFTGVVTFARDYDEVIKSIPIESIMSETDCPFVTPIPHRGKRNEPSYVIEIVKKISEIRNENQDFVAKSLVNNAIDFFRNI